MLWQTQYGKAGGSTLTESKPCGEVGGDPYFPPARDPTQHFRPARRRAFARRRGRGQRLRPGSDRRCQTGRGLGPSPAETSAMHMKGFGAFSEGVPAEKQVSSFARRTGESPPERLELHVG